RRDPGGAARRPEPGSHPSRQERRGAAAVADLADARGANGRPDGPGSGRPARIPCDPKMTDLGRTGRRQPPGLVTARSLSPHPAGAAGGFARERCARSPCGRLLKGPAAMKKAFDHIGLITLEPQPGESWVAESQVWVTNPRRHPNRIEYVRPKEMPSIPP